MIEFIAISQIIIMILLLLRNNKSKRKYTYKIDPIPKLKQSFKPYAKPSGKKSPIVNDESKAYNIENN